MKTKTTLSLLATVALLAAPRAAVAGGEGAAAAVGLIGGMIIGSQIGSTHTHTHTTETVVIERESGTAEAIEEGTAPPPASVSTTTETVVTRGGSAGYWEERPVQTWVPARWITTYDAYGFPIRRYEPGHYVTHMERVWVSGGVATVGPAPVVVAPSVAVVAPPYYYGSSYYPYGSGVHIGVGYTHYRGNYYGGYRHHYRSPPYRSHYNRPHYSSPRAHRAQHDFVKHHGNSGRSGKGLRPKFK